MASSISFRFDLGPKQLPLQKAYVALEFVDALGGVARGGLGQVSSAGKEERHERLVVVLVPLGSPICGLSSPYP